MARTMVTTFDVWNNETGRVVSTIHSTETVVGVNGMQSHIFAGEDIVALQTIPDNCEFLGWDDRYDQIMVNAPELLTKGDKMAYKIGLDESGVSVHTIISNDLNGKLIARNKYGVNNDFYYESTDPEDTEDEHSHYHYLCGSVEEAKHFLNRA